ncbi:hypothetical protein GCM10020000_28590 [Streptomyces olivoverticillatus]
MPRLTSDVNEPLTPIPGTPPSLLAPPPGCPFHPRCAYTAEAGGGEVCRTERPVLPPGRGAACHLSAERKRTVFNEQIKPRLG